MKFGQFISYYKRKKVIKFFCKNCNLKTSSWSFCVCKDNLYWKMEFLIFNLIQLEFLQNPVIISSNSQMSNMSGTSDKPGTSKTIY